MSVKIKICGMRFPENIIEIASLRPDYFGFIFYTKSPRFFDGQIPKIDGSIQKVGVFVNATLDEIEEKVKQYELDIVQLHGEESAEFCHLVQQKKIKVIKAFSIDNGFDFRELHYFHDCCNYFLFDTKGINHGGNGMNFDWTILQNYHLDKPYFLSGGIGLENLSDVNVFLTQPYAKHCVAIDCNSKLESFAGMKSVIKVKEFINAFKSRL